MDFTSTPTHFSNTVFYLFLTTAGYTDIKNDYSLENLSWLSNIMDPGSHGFMRTPWPYCSRKSANFISLERFSIKLSWGVLN